MKKSFLIYLFVLLVFVLGIYLILDHGPSIVSSGDKVHERMDSASAKVSETVESQGFFSRFEMHLHEPLVHLMVQLMVIVLAARIFGAIFTRIGQPAVIGEMTVGVLLGPSLFGWLAPGAFSFVFPTESLATLKLFSQIGICLFMFVVGMELELTHLRGRAHTALVVSHASIMMPFLLGVTSALFLYGPLSGAGATFTTFALFMGISMSITAFPVLARILEERGLSRTPLGSTAITCAAVDDVTAWSILAFIVAIAHAGSFSSSIFALIFTTMFVLVMLFVIRPFLPRWMGKKELEANTPGKGLLAGVLAFILLCGLITEIIGIQAFFGSFLAGVVMPRQGELRNWLKLRIEHFSTVFLVPLFFAYTGLRTQVGLLNDSQSWLICLAIIVVATVGKLGTSTITSRLTGASWSDAFSLGALMNTRGLMELIALNIGYDLGILSPGIFAMLVLMALITTFMTGPLLSLAQHFKSGARVSPESLRSKHAD
jgi:Kef-type K+ transport system membrane component KefB